MSVATATLHDMGCDFTAPFDHSAPVHHGGHQLLLREWPDDCVWAQLQYERWQQDRNGSNYTSHLYLENLDKEWGRRAICSRCHREIDQDLGEQMLTLETRAGGAEEKLSEIRPLLARTPDSELRPKLIDILDRR
ncbi:MAG TPA: hypothetical protein VMA73_17565 [Streptosporangiaceae bacterium]|nr:hypothetical protein [Streptosporangiaceae bacterium]